MNNNSYYFDDTFMIYDLVKFVKDGHIYTGHITKVHKSAISVSAYRTDPWDQKLGPTQKYFFRSTMFETFQIEWLDQHRGGDNSSIGVAPTWEDMSWVTYHEWRI